MASRWSWATKGPFERDADVRRGLWAGMVIGMVFGMTVAGAFVVAMWPPYPRYAVTAE